jgi:hypothetical protein
MAKTLVAAGVVLVSAFALGEEKAALQPLAPPPAAQLYQIDLVPGKGDSGKIISRDLPVLKGTVYVFHTYPTGTLTSVRKSTVKQISKMSPPAVAAANPTAIKPIGDLAMQGPKSAASSGGPRNMGRARQAVSAANAGTAGRTSYPE